MRALVVAVLLGAAGTALGRSKMRAKNATLWRGDAFTGRREKTLYGADDRMEQSQVEDSGVLGAGAATAALVSASDLSFNAQSRTWSRRYSCETFTSVPALR